MENTMFMAQFAFEFKVQTTASTVVANNKMSQIKHSVVFGNKMWLNKIMRIEIPTTDQTNSS